MANNQNDPFEGSDLSLDYWQEVPGYPVADWQLEVAENSTRLGYHEWVSLRREQDGSFMPEGEESNLTAGQTAALRRLFWHLSASGATTTPLEGPEMEELAALLEQVYLLIPEVIPPSVDVPQCEHEYTFSSYCGADVCDICGDHKGLARCYCGWSASGGDGYQELEEMGEQIEEDY